jgi:hypothetical protein
MLSGRKQIGAPLKSRLSKERGSENEINLNIFIIISKYVNPCLNQGRVEVIGKVLAGVFTSKTQERLIFTIRKP